MRIAILMLLGACGAKHDAPPAPDNHAADGAGGGALELRAEAVGGGHAAIVRNATAATVSLHRELRVERQQGASWEPVDASSLYLRETCDAVNGGIFEPPPCVNIAAGATFRAEPWTDDIGDAQCACEECGPAGAGTYRFFVMSCDDTQRVDSAPFTIR